MVGERHDTSASLAFHAIKAKPTRKPLDKEHGKICRKAFHYRSPKLTLQDIPHINPPCVVLDTNVVLDWRLFEDPRMGPLGTALGQGTIQWVATPWMMNEVRHMLSHHWPNKWSEKSKHLLDHAIWTDATLVSEPPSLPIQRLKCTDPDDQTFLDLSLSLPAKWLVTRDKALLKLGRQAALRGLKIQRPEDWRP